MRQRRSQRAGPPSGLRAPPDRVARLIECVAEIQIRLGVAAGLARPWRLARSQPRRRWVIAASILLHLSLLLLLAPWREPALPPEPLPPPTVAMVFESANPRGPSVPNPTPEASLPTPPTPPPQQPQPQPPAPQPVPAPPAPPAPPEVSLATPPAPPPPPLDLPPPPDLTAPEPLPPPAPAPPRPRPTPPVREAERPPSERQPNTAFPKPMNFSFGAPRSPSALERAFSSYAPGRAAKGDTSLGQFARVTKGRVDADWMGDLHRWWLEHRYYPEQAAMAGEDGTVKIQIQVDRYGHVRLVDLEGRSGSQWLDMAAQAVFRGATLPPFPPGTRDDQITVDLTINYILVRR